MLKNVAIPLMLAASQAEAQDAKLSKEMQEAVKESLRADLAKGFKGLQADAAACTVSSSQAADNIANLAQAVSDAKKQLADDIEAVNNLRAADGAWGLANEARQAAVKAVADSEAAENIAGLLDDLDTAAEAERSAAAAFVAADRLYQDGVRLAATEDQRNTDAQAKLGVLNTAKTNAEASVQAALDQITKETNWRMWRYCELGAAVANASLPDSSKQWWQMLGGTYSATLPATCVVPAVMDETQSPAVQERPAITYYTAKGASPGLPAESDDGTSRWTAQVVLAEAEAAEAATTSPAAMGGIARTQAGVVAWHTGNVVQKTWLHNRRVREEAWYKAVNTSRSNALTVATAMADTDSFATTGTLSTVQDAMGLTASTDGPAKALAAALTARDADSSASPGSGYAVGAARTQSTTVGEEWKTTWGVTTAGLDAWTAANTTKGPATLWWDACKTLTAAVDTWHTNWSTKSAQLTVGTMTQTVEGSTSCDLATGTWVTNNSDAQAATSLAECKTACESTTVGVLVADYDTTAGSAGATTTANNGGATMAKLSASGATTYCGAYSFNSGESQANLKCQLQLGTPNIAQADGTTVAGNGCAKFVNADFLALQSAQASVASGWAGVTQTLYDNMQSAADVQAGLEKAWLQAWYLQQYWAQIKSQLTESTAGTKSKTIYDEEQRLNTSGDATTVAGAETAKTDAQSNLDTAEAALATLQATTAAAQATVTALGNRILRADAQLAELGELVKTAPAKGTLDEAAELRVADYNAFNNDGTGADPKGEAVLAAEAKAAADLAVKARTTNAITDEAAYVDETRGDGGSLLEDRAVALAAWNKKRGETEAAENALTAALDGTVLATLRKQVEDDTAEWDKQDGVLAGLVAAVVGAEEALENAEKAKDAAVLACQIKAYDAYRTTLEGEMVQRIEDLKTIQALVEKQIADKPAPGTKGARCEKALSNGTFRPARGEAACAEGLCCGAARVWMAAGDGVEDAAWRTIETCQDMMDETYAYQPPRAPMATTMPPTVSVPFTCIEGAKKLAAAASAVAAAVYMLA